MKILPIGSAFALLLVLVACPSPDRAHEATADLPAATDPAVPTITPTPELVRVPLQAMGGVATVSGEVALRQVGAQTSVQFTLRDAPPNTSLAAHIHQGSCQQQGPVAVPLDPVITDGAGLGTSVTTVDTPLATLTDGQHYVQAHAPGERPGPPIACGEIPPRAQ
jgi:hypothetical protein